jgi:hypothetical protein
MPFLICPACEQTGSINFLLLLPDKHAVHQCDACGAEFIYPQPSDDELGRIYSEQYFIGSESEVGRERVAALKRATAALYLA